jgi:hypothetical protein
MPSSVVYVTKLDSNGLPSERPEARKAFKRAFGFQVRDNVPITITDWWQVPAAIKDKIWSNLKEKIKFPAGAEDVVKNAMFINMGRLFCKWKFKLNRKYVKKGLMPKHMGKITEAQWKEFVQQKTDPKPLPSVMNLLRCQRRTSIPITWDQRDMLLKFLNERRK